MRKLVFFLLYSLWSSFSLAQPSSPVKSFLETRLTHAYAPNNYSQYFRFADGLFPDRFTAIQEQQGKYAVYEIKLSQIAAMDIVKLDSAFAISLTFHQPIPILLRQDTHSLNIEIEDRWTLTFPFPHYREALQVLQAFQESNQMLDFRIRKQQSDLQYPEMIAMPETKAQLSALSKYPITVQQYRSYCYSTQQPMPTTPAWGWQANHPMVGITWQEAKDYTIWLSQQLGQVYDLPPLLLWRYAALDKLEEQNIDEIAWWGENSGGRTQVVGQKIANYFGLYDMQGNVWEWLAKSKDNDQYAEAAGGSWDSHFEQCQWDSKIKLPIEERDFTVGFRVVKHL